MNHAPDSAASAQRGILIVDDNARLAQIIALQLRLSGAWHLAGVAATRKEALREL